MAETTDCTWCGHRHADACETSIRIEQHPADGRGKAVPATIPCPCARPVETVDLVGALTEAGRRG